MPQPQPQPDDHLHIERINRSRLAINIAPLIDVVFLLLIFFMLTTSFLEPEAVVLQLPAAQETTTSATGRIVVHIPVTGDITINGQDVTLDRIAPRVRELLKANPGRPITIRAERAVPVQRTITVMDRVRAAGSDNIRFVTHMAH